MAEYGDDCCYCGDHAVDVSKCRPTAKCYRWAFSSDALRFMQQRQINGRLFHLAEFGGFIEWNAPTVKTFVDGRADIFVYNGVLNDYIKINAIDDSLELLDKYRIEYVLFPVNRRLTYLLDRSAAGR